MIDMIYLVEYSQFNLIPVTNSIFNCDLLSPWRIFDQYCLPKKDFLNSQFQLQNGLF